MDAAEDDSGIISFAGARVFLIHNQQGEKRPHEVDDVH